VRFVRSRVLFIAAITSLVVSGSLGFGGVASAGPPVPGAIVLHCTGVPGQLQAAINNAASDSTIKVDGTCIGGTFIDKNLTLSGPATVDGGTKDSTMVVWYGRVVVLNDLTIQHGHSPFQIGGGLGNNGQTTLNRSTVRENSADFGGGVFNTGQLTLNNSTVSDNTASFGGGIYNCGGNLGPFDCADNATVTLNNSNVSNNVVTNGNGGGILNDEVSALALNRSTVSGNTANGGGGIVNNGTATIDNSTLSGNTGFSGGAISNGVKPDGSGITTASLTITNSTVQHNHGVLLGGAITTSSALAMSHVTVSDNSAGPCPGDCFGFGGAGFGGAIFIFSQATTVAYSTFSNNTATSGPGSPVGIIIQPPSGPGTFSATHSTFS
jgi:hypothetical protein